MLSEILVGDLVTPHGPTDPFEYVATVVRLDDALVQVDLPEVLGEYPKDPSRTPLSAEQLTALRDALESAPAAEELLALLDGDTFIVSGGSGHANLMTHVALHEPALLGEGGLREYGVSGEGGRSPEGSPAFVAVVIALLLVLLAAGAWVAVRVVSGY